MGRGEGEGVYVNLFIVVVLIRFFSVFIENMIYFFKAGKSSGDGTCFAQIY